MKTTYDTEIDEWVCECSAGTFYGNTAAQAEAAATEALRVASDHARKNT